MKREKKYRRSQQAALFAGAMALLAMSAGCGRKTGAGEVHIGYFNNITHAQALYMKAQGMLEDAFGTQARVQWTAFHAGPAEVEAMFAGDIDIGYIGPIPAITANVRSDGDIQILSGAAMAGAQLMRAADADIETVADLDGKTVAVPQIGNTQHLCLLQLLSDYRLQTVEEGGTVKVTAVENADVQNMMDQGGIDAALVPEPWGTLLAENGAQTVLDYDEVYAGGDYPVAVVAVRKDFLEEEPELVNTFLQMHEEATQTIRKDTAAAAAVMDQELADATGSSLGQPVLERAFEKIILSTEVSPNALDDFARISLEQGFIEETYEKLFAKRQDDSAG